VVDLNLETYFVRFELGEHLTRSSICREQIRLYCKSRLQVNTLYLELFGKHHT